MNIMIYPGKLHGIVQAIPSKSHTHRLLICAAFSDSPTFLRCPQTNQDIEATADCLRSLGVKVERSDDGYHITPVSDIPKQAILDCRESGTTLRLMLPICCALGVETTFRMSGRLPYRPLSPLWEELERMGCALTRPADHTIHVTGKLCAGHFIICGDVSSQFISGLLFAAALMDGKSQIEVVGRIESLPYIQMTQQALAAFGIASDNYEVTGGFPFRAPRKLNVEGDWSNAAFFLAAKELGSDLIVEGLDFDCTQGDRAVAEILKISSPNPRISAANIPDLVPILAIFFAARSGAVFTDIQRLRLKESDRVASVCQMMNALGAKAEADETTLTVYPGKFHACSIDSAADHRIAMAAAIAATVADGPVNILGAECVAKSYPAFWQEFSRLGGHYEQYIR